MRIARNAVLLFLIQVLAGISLQGSAAAQDTPESYARFVAPSLADTHVYLDSNASSPITREQAGQLSEQIRSTGKPLYVAFVDDTRAQYGKSSPWPSHVYEAMGSPADWILLVFGAGDKFGLYAAPGTPDIATGTLSEGLRQIYEENATANAGNADRYAVVRQFVDIAARVDIVRLPGGQTAPGTGAEPSTRTPENSTHSDAGPPLWPFIVGGLLAVAACTLLVARRRRHRTGIERIPTTRRD